jgi:hypothetical protein
MVPMALHGNSFLCLVLSDTACAVHSDDSVITMLTRPCGRVWWATLLLFGGLRSCLGARGQIGHAALTSANGLWGLCAIVSVLEVCVCAMQ